MKRLKKFSYLILAFTCLCGQAPGQTEEKSTLALEFENRINAIENLDAEAHFKVGFDFYKKYNSKKHDNEALSLAVDALKIASNQFTVTLKSGKIHFIANEEGKADWANILKESRDSIHYAYAQIHKKTIEETKDVDLLNLNPGDQAKILHQQSKNWEKASDEDKSKQLEVAPVHPYATKLLDVVKKDLKSAKEKANPDYWKMVFAVVGGLGIFLIGMKNLSEGMQGVAGARLRKMINAVTDNRILATAVGTGVTCIVQSSSITTVIVVGLVNGGLMALHQAIGVIMGANIGTTITGWILVLKIGKYGLPILGVSVFVYLFSKKDNWRYIAMATMGLGMVFFGLEMMKNGFKPMKGVPAFEEAFLMFDAHSYFGVLKCAAVGCILTFIVQSSSATLGITIGLASTGIIPFETAAALVLGENIGTTITAWLASIGTSTNAKRAAYAHVFFNLLGVVWITAIFSVYITLVGSVVKYFSGYNPIGLTIDSAGDLLTYGAVVTGGIAATHTGFNVTNTLMFLPFVRHFTRLLERFVPEQKIKSQTRLDPRLVESPVLGIETSRGEILKMGTDILEMLDKTKDVIRNPKSENAVVERVFLLEKNMDNWQQQIIEFMTELLTSEVPHSITNEGRQQIRIADEYESVSDYIGAILKAILRLKESHIDLENLDLQAIVELHELVTEYVKSINESLKAEDTSDLSRAQIQGDKITIKVKELRESHLNRIVEQKVDPIESLSFTTMLNAYRKIKDHALNIAETIGN